MYAALIGAALCTGLLNSTASADSFDVPVSYGQVPLNPGNADDELTAAGDASPIIYRGGLELRSSEDRFGGLSGLLVEGDGTRLIAVTDIGYWLTAQLSYDAAGNLAGISDVHMSPVLDRTGDSVAGSKKLGDAEGLTRLSDGRLAVSFERTHRVWAYDVETHGFAAPAQPVAIHPELRHAVNNKGLEAIVQLPDRTLLAITEATMSSDDHIVGWHVDVEESRRIALKRVNPFDLTDMALLPNGDVLTLERRYSTLGGVGAQIRLIEVEDLFARDGANDTALDGPILYRSSAGQTVDNMEGLATLVTPQGKQMVFLVSDDNFNPLQRTLLLMFELPN